MRYDITVESYFSAAHRLKGYRGKCEKIHGHNWKVVAVITSRSLDKTGMVLDFKEARRLLDKILVSLDHKQLDKTRYFRNKNPTSENIAEFIFNEYQKRLKEPLELKGISVWETPTSSTTFSND